MELDQAGAFQLPGAPPDAERREPVVTDTPLTAVSEPAAGSGRISLRTLVPIRWVAIAGQSLAILIVHYGLGFHLPVMTALSVVAGSVLLNVALIVYRQSERRLGERYAALCLGYDILQLAILLYLTGGLQNPFSILILAPVTVAATILSRRPVIALSIFAVDTISVLALWHLPLPWRTDPGPLVFPPELVVGIWTALVLATVFIGGYTWSVAQDARQLRDAVAATQLALAREQRVSAVGALAAAAAHELPPDSPLAEDAALLLSQSERCRHILAELSQRPEEDGGSPYTRLPVSALVEAAVSPRQERGIRLIFATAGGPAEDEPQVRRSPEILHGLNNLIQNAVQFARREVMVTTFWDPATVTVEISDDGPGFPLHLMARLGEPYLSTRAGATDHMGLGIFIAQSLLERSGARLDFENLEDGGAHVAISWNRANLETSEKLRQPAASAHEHR